MLSIFRTNQAYAGLLLLFYALLLQLPYFFPGAGAPGEVHQGGYLATWVNQGIAGRPLLSLLLPVLLLFVQGILANFFVTRHRLSRAVTQFPGLFLILSWALVPAFHSFHPYQAANIFLLFALLSLGRIYKRQEPAVALFNTGAWLGIASLFAPEYLLFIPAFLAGVGIFRQPGLRSLLQLLMGTLLLYFLVLTFVYGFGETGAFLRIQFGPLGLFTPSPLTAPNHLLLLLTGMLVGVVIFASGNLARLLNIEGKKGIGFLYVLLLFTPFVLAIGGLTGAAEVQVLTVPLGILLGVSFLLLSPPKARLLHLLLLLAALLPPLLRLFGG